MGRGRSRGGPERARFSNAFAEDLRGKGLDARPTAPGLGREARFLAGSPKELFAVPLAVTTYHFAPKALRRSPLVLPGLPLSRTNV